MTTDERSVDERSVSEELSDKLKDLGFSSGLSDKAIAKLEKLWSSSPEVETLKAEIQRIIDGNQADASSQIKEIAQILQDLVTGRIAASDIPRLTNEVKNLAEYIEVQNQLQDSKPGVSPKVLKTEVQKGGELELQQ